MTLAIIGKDAGLTIQVEASESRAARRQADMRAADVLIHGIDTRPLAVDVTIDSTNMDYAAKRKNSKSRDACNAVGWSFMPFVCNTYGAMRADARDLIKKIGKILAEKSPDDNCRQQFKLTSTNRSFS